MLFSENTNKGQHHPLTLLVRYLPQAPLSIHRTSNSSPPIPTPNSNPTLPANSNSELQSYSSRQHHLPGRGTTQCQLHATSTLPATTTSTSRPYLPLQPRPHVQDPTSLRMHDDRHFLPSTGAYPNRREPNETRAFLKDSPGIHHQV
jgi:hypothetical protein